MGPLKTVSPLLNEENLGVISNIRVLHSLGRCVTGHYVAGGMSETAGYQQESTFRTGTASGLKVCGSLDLGTGSVNIPGKEEECQVLYVLEIPHLWTGYSCHCTVCFHTPFSGRLAQILAKENSSSM